MMTSPQCSMRVIRLEDKTSVYLRQLDSTTLKRTSLVIIFSWYGASDGALQKYFNLYHNCGYDILFVPAALKDFTWPKNCLRLSHSLLSFLCTQCDSYKHFIAHAFSFGAYIYAVCMETIYQNPKVYENFRQKLRGNIFDSLTMGSLERMRSGVASGSSQSKVIRGVISALMGMYFYVTHNHTVVYYDYYIDVFKRQPFNVPTVLFYCRNDPMSDANVVDEMLILWRKKDDFRSKVISKCWEKSRHCGHLLTHKDEYVQTIRTFLDIHESTVDSEIDLVVSKPEKAKL